MVKQAESSSVFEAFDEWCSRRPFLSPKIKKAMMVVFMAGYHAGLNAKIFCSVCKKQITSQYVARDTNNNAYCSTKCFAEKRRSERNV
jgi:hypothetical protein